MFDLMGTSGLSAQTWHLGFGGSSASVTKIFFLGFGCRLRYTVLHLSSLPCRISSLGLVAASDTQFCTCPPCHAESLPWVWLPPQIHSFALVLLAMQNHFLGFGC